MTARRALLDDEVVEIVEPAVAPRRAVMPALADMAVASRSEATAELSVVGGTSSRTTSKGARSRRRFAAPATAVAAVSALGVISSLVPAAATSGSAAPAGANATGGNDAVFSANALNAVSEGQASTDALNDDISALADLNSGIDTAAADAAVKAADSEQAAKDKAAADKAAAAALAQQEASSSAASAQSSSSAASTSGSVTASSASAQAAVNFAMAQIGKPYGWGSTGPDSYDCSGLMMAAYASAGVSIPRTSEAQQAGLTSVSLSNLQVGDLVFFYGGSHVGMYIGNGQVVHAPTSGDVVKISDMNSMGPTGAARVAG
ncbi:MAG: C40 family peptidase [Propionibacterium acidifaciens]